MERLGFVRLAFSVQAEQEVKRLLASRAASAPTPEERLAGLERVAEHSPRAAILEKRAELKQPFGTWPNHFLKKSAKVAEHDTASKRPYH